MDAPLAHHDRYPDAQIRALMKATRTIALVGASANPARPSYIVLKYLSERGYTVTPVNPGLAGQTLLGMTVISRLAELPGPVDMVEIFRNSIAADGLVDEALALPELPKLIWMQLGVRNDAAAARRGARRHGDHESLPEDRVRPPVGGDRLDRRELADHQLQEAGARQARRTATDDRRSIVAPAMDRAARDDWATSHPSTALTSPKAGRHGC